MLIKIHKNLHRRSSLSTQSSTKIIRLFAFVWIIWTMTSLCWRKRIDQLMEISLRRVSSLTQNEQQKMANYLKINNINLTLQSQCYWPSKSMLLAFKVNTISLQSQCYWPSKSMLLERKSKKPCVTKEKHKPFYPIR